MSDKPATEPPKIKRRIEALSDLVFGLALSLVAIALIGHIPTANGPLITDVENFGFSFLIIVGVWLGYTRIASTLEVETGVALLLNLVLLFCVALEPFLFYVQTTAPAGSSFLGFSSAIYGLDIGFMMAILSAMMYAIVREYDRKKIDILHWERGSYMRALRTEAIAAVLFITSSLSGFSVTLPEIGYLRFFVWYLALAIFFTARVLHQVAQRNQPATEADAG